MCPNDVHNGDELDSRNLAARVADEVDDAELSDLEQALHVYMEKYMVQAPSQSDTDALLTCLKQQFQLRLGNEDDLLLHRESIQHDPFSSLQSKRSNKYSFMRLISLQFRIYSKAILFITIALIGCMTALAISHVQIVKGEQLLSFSIPLLVIASVIYGIRSGQNKFSHLQEISPYPPVLQFIARVFLVSSICLLLGLLSSLILYLTQEQFRSFSFIWSWIAPTALLSGQLVYVIQRRGIVPGIVSSIVVWLCYMLFTQSSWSTYIPFLSKTLGVAAFIIGIVFLVITIVKLMQHPAVRSWRIDET